MFRHSGQVVVVISLTVQSCWPVVVVVGAAGKVGDAELQKGG
jgi:hypothetical protein